MGLVRQSRHRRSRLRRGEQLYVDVHIFPITASSFSAVDVASMYTASTLIQQWQAREEICKERQRYLEALAVYIEATSMVEEYQQAVSMANLGGIRDVQGCLSTSRLVELIAHEALEHRMVVAEAAQRLRLPLISKDGEIHEEEIEKWSIASRSSLHHTPPPLLSPLCTPPLLSESNLSR